MCSGDQTDWEDLVQTLALLIPHLPTAPTEELHKCCSALRSSPEQFLKAKHDYYAQVTNVLLRDISLLHSDLILLSNVPSPLLIRLAEACADAASRISTDRFSDTERLYTAAIVIYTATSPTSFNLAEAYHHMGLLYHQRAICKTISEVDSPCEMAERMFIRALSIYATNPLDSGMCRASTLSHLGALYITMQKEDNAVQMYQKALWIYSQCSTNVREEKRTIENLALIYRKQGRFAEAETLFVKLLQMQRVASTWSVAAIRQFLRTGQSYANPGK